MYLLCGKINQYCVWKYSSIPKSSSYLCCGLRKKDWIVGPLYSQAASKRTQGYQFNVVF